MNKNAILRELATYAQVIHDALETESHHENRWAHLGHLGMAARIFIAIELPNSTVNLPRIYDIERMAYGSKYPGDAAAAMRDAWARFHPRLKNYIESDRT